MTTPLNLTKALNQKINDLKREFGLSEKETLGLLYSLLFRRLLRWRLQMLPKVDWENYCPNCKGWDIRFNEIGAYKWCGQCGKYNIPITGYNPETLIADELEKKP